MESILSAKLQAYINSHGMRQTPERYEILATCIALDVPNKPFAASQVYERYKDSGGIATKATIYSTIQLLQEAGIIVRVPVIVDGSIGHLFSYHFESHVALLCTHCQGLTLYKRKRLLHSIELVQTGSMEVSMHTLYLYGLCSHCKRLNNRRQKQHPEV